MQKKQVATQKEESVKAVQPPAVKERGPKLVTSKEMIMWEYPDVFQGIGKFPGPDYHIQIESKRATQANTMQMNPYSLESAVSTRN